MARGHVPKVDAGGFTSDPRLEARQVLYVKTQWSRTFYAVVIDPDTQKRLAKVPICTLDPGEAVELVIEHSPVREEV